MNAKVVGWKSLKQECVLPLQFNTTTPTINTYLLTKNGWYSNHHFYFLYIEPGLKCSKTFHDAGTPSNFQFFYIEHTPPRFRHLVVRPYESAMALPNPRSSFEWLDSSGLALALTALLRVKLLFQPSFKCRRCVSNIRFLIKITFAPKALLRTYDLYRVSRTDGNKDTRDTNQANAQIM